MNRIALLLASTALAIAAPAFANTNRNSTLWICATPQASDLDQSDYEALVWVQIKGVGSHGEVGTNTNMLTYDTWDQSVVQKSKGMSDAGSPEIELARNPFDPGQIILNDAALTEFNYAFKIIRNDRLTAAGTPTVIYNRGVVAGPRRPMGRNEDFDLEIFTLGLNQKEVVDNAGAGGAAPAFTALPAITGTATVGETLSVSNGTVTGDATITYQYRWYAAGVPIAGATSATYILTAAETGKIITARVYASNASGNAVAFSGATTAVSAS